LSATNTLFNGIFLFDQKTARSQVFLQRGNIFSQVEWDLQRGKVLNTSSLPLAPGYQWNADGSLFPTIGYRYLGHFTRKIDIAPVGEPVGSYSFSIWQPGTVVLNTPTLAGSPSSGGPAVYTWNTSF